MFLAEELIISLFMLLAVIDCIWCLYKLRLSLEIVHVVGEAFHVDEDASMLAAGRFLVVLFVAGGTAESAVRFVGAEYLSYVLRVATVTAD